MGGEHGGQDSRGGGCRARVQGVRLEITEGKVGVGENGGQEKGRRGAQGAGLESTDSKDGGRGEHGCKG